VWNFRFSTPRNPCCPGAPTKRRRPIRTKATGANTAKEAGESFNGGTPRRAASPPEEVRAVERNGVHLVALRRRGGSASHSSPDELGVRRSFCERQHTREANTRSGEAADTPSASRSGCATAPAERKRCTPLTPQTWVRAQRRNEKAERSEGAGSAHGIPARGRRVANGAAPLGNRRHLSALAGSPRENQQKKESGAMSSDGKSTGYGIGALKRVAATYVNA